MKIRWLLFLSVLLFSLIFLQGTTGARRKWNRGPLARNRNKKGVLAEKCSPVKLAFILCDVQTESIINDFGRQMNQTMTLLKSILITMEGDRCGVHVILISNKKEHFDRIQNEIFGNGSKWDSRFTKRLEFEYLPLKYPQGLESLRDLYRQRPCSSLRLFLPDILPYDSVILSDTDIIYLRSIRDLWSELGKFNHSAAIGVVPRLLPRKRGCTLPFYGQRGIGSAVLLMNLTRMRENNWSRTVVEMSKPYMDQVRVGLAEEAMMDIYFQKFPEIVHPLSCDWNFHPHDCLDCKESRISGLHGNGCAFTKSIQKEPLYRAVYETFQNTYLTSDFRMEDLVGRLGGRIERDRKIRPGTHCGRSGNFKERVLGPLQAKIPTHARTE